MCPVMPSLRRLQWSPAPMSEERVLARGHPQRLPDAASIEPRFNQRGKFVVRAKKPNDAGGLQ